MHKGHSIYKQVLEVETADPSAKIGFQQEIYDLYTDRLLPRMESLFDQCAGQERVIRAEKLEIRVTIPYSKSWKENLCQAVTRELEKVLKDIKPIAAWAEGGRERMFMKGEAGGSAAVHVPPEDAEAILLYFLANGVLPWYAGKWSLERLRAWFVQMWQETEGSPYESGYFAGRLLRLLTSKPVALSRLISQFGESLLMVRFADTREYKILQRWAFLLPPGQGQRTSLWAILLPLLSDKGIGAASEPLMEKMVLGRLLSAVPKDLLAVWWREGASSGQRKELWRVLEPDMADDIVDLPMPTGIRFPEGPGIRGAGRLPEEGGHSLASELTEEGVYIDNAGLVILHPFLPALFTALGYWDGRNFVSEALHQRAVILSQYIIYPGEEFPEHQLLLNKVLCGYEWEETLLSVLVCEEKEIMQTEELLQAVIRYWVLNGNPVITTVENLRASFLQRPGKLIRRSGDWLLQVEKKGYDIVLKGLPWGIGIIKHPWMREMLRVEWV